MVGSTLRLRKEFTRALLAGDAEAADRVIRAAMDSGLNAAEIDIELITPALFMVGDKWATGEITVADEHLASEITLRVLALQRAVRHARRQRRDRRVLLLAPQGERHVIGLNMACDLLYAAGYDTLMLGADVPFEDIVPAAIRHAADVIAFSATMDETNEVLDAAIDHLRMSKHGPASCSAARRCRSRSPRRGTPRSAATSRTSSRPSTRSCSTRRSTEQARGELLPQPLVADAHDAEHGAAGEDDARRARDGHVAGLQLELAELERAWTSTSTPSGTSRSIVPNSVQAWIRISWPPIRA